MASSSEAVDASALSGDEGVGEVAGRSLQTTTEVTDDLDAREAGNVLADAAAEQEAESDGEPAEEREDRHLSEQERRRIELNRRIDMAVKGPKKRPKKKADETDLEQVADDEVERMRQMMIAAAEEDQQAKLDGKPATSKLRLLKEAVETLQKTGYQQAILDNNLLQGVKLWLEPLKADGSLPSLNIQRALFPILETSFQHIDVISLKMSGLGGLMVFYTRKKSVDKNISRIAERLIESWSRPILKRSSSYRDRLQASREFSGVKRPRISEAQRQRAAAESAASQASRRARIPDSVTGNAFRYAPASQVVDGAMDESQIAKQIERQKMNKFKRSMMSAKR